MNEHISTVPDRTAVSAEVASVAGVDTDSPVAGPAGLERYGARQRKR